MGGFLSVSKAINPEQNTTNVEIVNTIDDTNTNTEVASSVVTDATKSEILVSSNEKVIEKETVEKYSNKIEVEPVNVTSSTDVVKKSIKKKNKNKNKVSN